MTNQFFDAITRPSTDDSTRASDNAQENLVQDNFFAMVAAQMTDGYNHMNNSASSTLTMCSQMLTDTCDFLKKNTPLIVGGLCCVGVVTAIVVPCVLLLNQPCKTAYILNKTGFTIYYESGRILKPDYGYYADLPKEGEPTKEQALEWGSLFPVECTQKLRADSKENADKQLVVFTGCDNPKVKDKGFCRFDIDDLYDNKSNSKTASVNSHSLFSFFDAKPTDKQTDSPHLRGSYNAMGN